MVTTLRPHPLRGEVWLADLDPTRGHEQAGRRPVLVISDDVFNRGPAELVIVVPITSRNRGIRSRVVVKPPEGGLLHESTIICEGVRSVARERLSHRLGAVGSPSLHEVERILRHLMNL